MRRKPEEKAQVGAWGRPGPVQAVPGWPWGWPGPRAAGGRGGVLLPDGRGLGLGLNGVVAAARCPPQLCGGWEGCLLVSSPRGAMGCHMGCHLLIARFFRCVYKHSRYLFAVLGDFFLVSKNLTFPRTLTWNSLKMEAHLKNYLVT